MRQYVLAMGVLLGAGVVLAKDLPENLLKNGDFGRLLSFWRSDGKVVKLDVTEAKPDGNPALEIKLHPKRNQSLSQKFKVDKDVRVLKLRFRVKKGDGYKPGAPTIGDLTLTFHREDGRSRGATYLHSRLNDYKNWQDVSWTFGQLEDAKRMTIEVETLPGEGVLYFDDFVIEPAAK
ncbi:MAG: hypothetical protein JXR37_02770 [Kiritimatiellae bacterium]|nr:hypothetical protein [Kiritimatiellia bacterium]